MSQQERSPRAFVKTADERIRGVLGTSGLAVAVLVCVCIAVEVGILFATQQYEAATAPKGTAMVLGMSAAGMVVFLAELLKLPVAWVSGVVSGRNRLLFNIVTVFLCILTAYTIKDLTTREWNLALEPSRALRREADEKLAEIASLEKKKADLAQDTSANAAYWREQIALTNAELESIQQRKVTEQKAYTERLRALVTEQDPGSAERIRSIEQSRDKAVEAIDADIATLLQQRQAELAVANDAAGTRGKQFDDEVARVERLREEVKRRNREAEQSAEAKYQSDRRSHEEQLTRYEAARDKYESDRAAVITKRDQELKDLEARDEPFFDLAARQKAVREAADKEIARLEGDFKQRPLPVSPTRSKVDLEPLPPLPTRDRTSGSEGAAADPITASKQIAELRDQRMKQIAVAAAEIKAIAERISANSAAANAASAEQRRMLEESFNALVRGFDSQISALIERRTKEERERASFSRSPAEIQRESDEITSRLPELRKDAERLRSQAEKEAIDTNPIRSASGVIRWLMPGSSASEQESAAFGIFPLLIGILVATLPALLLEVGVHSLKPERARARWSLLKTLMGSSRHRKALELLNRRAAGREQRCSEREKKIVDDERSYVERRAQREAELHEQLQGEISQFLEPFKAHHTKLTERIHGHLKESDGLHAELQASKAALAARNAELTEQMKTIVDLRMDIDKLVKQVTKLDAQKPA